jgi:phosphoribosylaminoimidazole carboxylase PurE protein
MLSRLDKKGSAMPQSDKPLVAVVMGSVSDWTVMEGAFGILEKFGVPYEAKVLSAHRTPNESAEYFNTASSRGIKVIIAGAGGAAHLAGSAAANAIMTPVIGVPIDSSPLNGLDALLATVQMPPGIPVATMSIGKWGSVNAALFAIQILSVGKIDTPTSLNLLFDIGEYRKNLADNVLITANDELRKRLQERDDKMKEERS